MYTELLTDMYIELLTEQASKQTAALCHPATSPVNPSQVLYKPTVQNPEPLLFISDKPISQHTPALPINSNDCTSIASHRASSTSVRRCICVVAGAKDGMF